MKNYIIQLILFFFILPFSIYAQGWEEVYDNANNERIFSAETTLDGGVVMAGTIHNYETGPDGYLQIGIGYSYLMKVDVDGNMEWKHIDSVHIGEYIRMDDVLATSDGNYLVSFIYGPDNSNTNSIIRKVTPEGTVLWENDLSAHALISVGKMIETADNNYILYGSVLEGDYYGIGLGKIDTEGALIWENSFSLADTNTFLGNIKEANNGDLIVVSHIGVAFEWKDIVLKRLDSNGNEIWSQEYAPSSYDFGLDVVELTSGDLVLAGLRLVEDTNIYESLLLKTDAAGNEIWTKLYNSVGTGSQRVAGLVETVDGGLALGGTIIQPIEDNDFDFDFFLLKVDEEGNELWNERYGTGETRNDYLSSIVNALDGGFYLAGYTAEGSISNDGYLVKTDSLGRILPNELIGNVFQDIDLDCSMDTGELGLEQWLIQVSKDDIQYSTLTDENGNYSFRLDTGTYDMQVFPTSPYWTVCESQLHTHFHYYI